MNEQLVTELAEAAWRVLNHDNDPHDGQPHNVSNWVKLCGSIRRVLADNGGAKHD